MFRAHQMLAITSLPIRNLKPMFLKGRRQIKIKKWKKYPCVPDFMQGRKKDPFDYTLQTKEQARDQLMLNNNFPFVLAKTFTNDDYVPGNTYLHGTILEKEKAKILFDLKDFPLSTCQKERLIFLLGPRYNEKEDQGKIVITDHPEFNLNLQKGIEIYEELLLEALRAPNVDSRAIRDPYYKDRAKISLGKTKEERDAKEKAAEEFRLESIKLAKEGNLFSMKF